MDLEKVVCFCCNVTNGMIKEAVEEGAKTVDDIQAITGAGTICGGCLDNIEHLLDEFVEK